METLGNYQNLAQSSLMKWPQYEIKYLFLEIFDTLDQSGKLWFDTDGQLCSFLSSGGMLSSLG